MAYLLLFVWCFLASSIIPLSSEPYFAKLVADNQIWIMPVIIASIGNTLGSITTFWMGKKAEELTIHKLSASNQKRVDKAQNILHKHGPIALILSWIPFLGDVLVAIGGALHFPFWQSALWITVGKTLRYVMLAGIVLQFF